jgi:protein involved in polysaccharide export with SLBB domain
MNLNLLRETDHPASRSSGEIKNRGARLRRLAVGKLLAARAMVCSVALMTVSLVWLTVLVSPLKAQQKRDQQPDPPTRSSPYDPSGVGVLADAAKDYLISPGDVVEIKVEDAPELSHHYRVTAAGYIEMPVLGRLLARQKTTYALARQITDVLREQEYLKTPTVVATVTQYNSRTFFVQGAVQRPGLYQVEGNPSLITLISLAGGLADNHGSTAMILRPKNTRELVPDPETAAAVSSKIEKQGKVHPQQTGPGSAADYDLIRLNLSALYKGQFDQNQRLESGDIINIPRADVFFVAGEVKAPGSFALKEGTTLSQAISLAQGMTFKAKASRGLIFREDPATGKRQEIKVDISAVMKGRGEDMPVRANDVIIVPNSKGKTVGGAILMTLGANVVRFPIP